MNTLGFCLIVLGLLVVVVLVMADDDQVGRVVWHEVSMERRDPKLARQLTQFSCRRRRPGYYSDVASDCQLYHACRLDPESKLISRTTYLCPEGQRFGLSQRRCGQKDDVKCEGGFAPLDRASSSWSSKKDFFFNEDIWDAEDDDPRHALNKGLNIWYIPEKRQLKCYTCCRPRKNTETNEGASRPTYPSTSSTSTPRPWTTTTRHTRPTWIVHVPRPTRPTIDSADLDVSEIEIIDAELKSLQP